MNTAEIRRAAEALPLTVDNLRALIGAAESFALAMHKSGQCINAGTVHDSLLDAFVGCDDIEAVTHEMRSEWALNDMLNRREAA